MRSDFNFGDSSFDGNVGDRVDNGYRLDKLGFSWSGFGEIGFGRFKSSNLGVGAFGFSKISRFGVGTLCFSSLSCFGVGSLDLGAKSGYEDRTVGMYSGYCLGEGSL